MNYAASSHYSGSAPAALEAVETTLLPNGFRIVGTSDGRLELRGRGMRNSRENPLRGATGIVVEAAGGILHLKAELGGVKSMALFVCLFPLVLWIGLMGTFLLTSGENGSGFDAKVFYGAAVWLVIGPLMAFWMRKRTIRALDDMMANAVAKAGRGHDTR